MIEHKWKKKMEALHVVSEDLHVVSEALHVVSPAVLKDLKRVVEGGGDL